MKNENNPDAKPVQVPLGEILIRPEVLRTVSRMSLDEILKRHASGDWGMFGDQGISLRTGEQLFSIHEVDDNRVLIVMTEGDRETTFVALIEDPFWKDVFDDGAERPAIAMH